MRQSEKQSATEPQLFWNMSTLLPICLDFTSVSYPNGQILKWAWQCTNSVKKFNVESLGKYFCEMGVSD